MGPTSARSAARGYMSFSVVLIPIADRPLPTPRRTMATFLFLEAVSSDGTSEPDMSGERDFLRGQWDAQRPPIRGGSAATMFEMYRLAYGRSQRHGSSVPARR